MTDTLTFGTYGFDDPWNMPWYNGEATAPQGLVPRKFPVSIADHPYPIDFDKYRRTTMQIRRLQTDDSVEPGENSLNATGLWPRAQDNFFLGAGQLFLDNRFAFESVYVHSGEFPSVRTRYWRSKRLNPWNEGSMSLHHEQTVIRSTNNTNLLMCATLNHLYVADGDDVFFTANPGAITPTWTSSGIGAVLGAAITGLATDGNTVWACDGTNGVGYSIDGATSATLLTGTYAATNLWYAKGWLLGTTGRDLVTVNPSSPAAYNTALVYQVGQQVTEGGDTYVAIATVPTATAPPDATYWDAIGVAGPTTLIWTHPSFTFVWTTVTDTPSTILVAGNAGNQSFVGSLQADAATEGATLAVPYAATTLPPGETVNDVAYSAGFVLLATSEGIRSGTRPDSTGIFDVNPVITDPGPTLCVAPYQQYCYFGWSAYTTIDDQIFTTGVSCSGLGRADLSQYSNPGVPAYATDVMAEDGTQEAVTDCVIFQGTPYFCLEGVGVYGPSGNREKTGFFQPGWVRYGTLETKILSSSFPQHDPLNAGESVAVSVSDEFGNISPLGVSNIQGSTSPSSPFGGNLAVGQKFMPIITLNRGTDASDGPVLHSWIDKAMVTPPRQDEIICPIIMKTRIDDYTIDGEPYRMDTLAEFLFLKSLENSGEPIIYQEGSQSIQCYIDQVQVAPYGMNHMQDDADIWFEALVTVKLITLFTSTE